MATSHYVSIKKFYFTLLILFLVFVETHFQASLFGINSGKHIQ